MNVINTGFRRCLASMILLFLAAHPAWARPAPIEGTPPSVMPALSYTDEKGATHRLNTSGHALTALHFWATWCVPCVAELPQVDAAQKAYGASGFQVIALSLDGRNMQKVTQFFADNDIQALSPLLDPDMSAFRAVQGRGLPTTLFINNKNQLIARADGPLDWESDEVKEFINKSLNKHDNHP